MALCTCTLNYAGSDIVPCKFNIFSSLRWSMLAVALPTSCPGERLRVSPDFLGEYFVKIVEDKFAFSFHSAAKYSPTPVLDRSKSWEEARVKFWILFKHGLMKKFRSSIESPIIL